MDGYDVYSDINERTGGEIYLGCVGAVRTGKSTFIKRFMEQFIIPEMKDEKEQMRAIDELPQSSDGRTIMTTEPKFVPKQAVELEFSNGSRGRIRLIDCVGFLVKEAEGYREGEKERMVKTPWEEEEIPFSKAAEIGTRKVITEHSQIAIIITADGSFSEFTRSQYEEAEAKTVAECKKTGKPMIMVLNSANPREERTRKLAEKLAEQYQISVIPIDCKHMQKEDVDEMMERLLDDFPVSKISFFFPKWIEFLAKDHWLKKDFILQCRKIMKKMTVMRGVKQENLFTDADYIKQVYLKNKDLSTGEVSVGIEMEDPYYYEILSDMIGTPITGEYDLIATLKDLAAKKEEYESIAVACGQVKGRGYGIVTPTLEEIQIEEPELIKHGNKFGVKIKAICPSIHLIQANIETEIAPIVGSEEQALDLIRYIEENGKDNPDGIYDTNIFGKTIRQLVDDGIQNKVNRLTEESQVKLQDTIQKVINDSNGGLICIII